jgi:hypothetical protein
VAGIKLGFTVLNSTCVYILKRGNMREDYEGVKHGGFPPRWWVMSLVAPAVWIAAGVHNATLGRVKPAQ